MRSCRFSPRNPLPRTVAAIAALVILTALPATSTPVDLLEADSQVFILDDGTADVIYTLRFRDNEGRRAIRKIGQFYEPFHLNRASIRGDGLEGPVSARSLGDGYYRLDLPECHRGRGDLPDRAPLPLELPLRRSDQPRRRCSARRLVQPGALGSAGGAISHQAGAAARAAGDGGAPRRHHAPHGRRPRRADRSRDARRAGPLGLRLHGLPAEATADPVCRTQRAPVRSRAHGETVHPGRSSPGRLDPGLRRIPGNRSRSSRAPRATSVSSSRCGAFSSRCGPSSPSCSTPYS